jgi:hypothetical protein
MPICNHCVVATEVALQEGCEEDVRLVTSQVREAMDEATNEQMHSIFIYCFDMYLFLKLLFIIGL